MRRKIKRENNCFKKSFSIILTIIFIALIAYVSYNKIIKYQKEKEKFQEETAINNIKKHYSQYVITTKETNLLNKDEEVVGKINNNVKLSLGKTSVTKETKYFELSLEGDTYYISYEDVIPTEEFTTSDRYKNYIPYNQNIITNETTTFYDNDNNYLYEISKSYEFPIIIKDTNRYGIIYNNNLLYIKKDDVSKVENHHNTDKSNSNGVAVLNYHFFYDENNPEDAAGCREVICHTKKQFKTHLDYLKEKNIFTVTMNELEMYMDGKLQLPKSVLITIDDGARTKDGVDLLTEYKMNATIFLITSWHDPKTYYKTDYIELHSHSHNLHNGGKCSGGQGAEIKCLPKDEILKDLAASRESLNGSTAFCYPFYEYNAYSTNLLKEAGFTMAFIGEVPTSYGYQLATVKGDKYKIPRFVIMTHTTIKDLDDYFNEIKN